MRPAVCLTFVLLMAGPAGLRAQASDRSKPPATQALHAWKAAPVYETTLPNGLTVLLAEDDRVPLVTMRLAFACGSKRDPADKPGVASIVGDMLMQGTARLTHSQIVEAVDGAGGAMSVASGPDRLVISGSAIAESLNTLLAIGAHLARDANFPELDLKLYLQNRFQSLSRQRSQPGYAASEAFGGTLFGGHPYARIGSAAGIGRISQKDLVDYRRNFLVPNNAILVLVGKLPPRAQVVKTIADGLGPWERKPVPEASELAIPAPKRRLVLIDRPGAAQAEIVLGRIAPSRRDADYLPALVAEEIAGAARNGRLLASNARGEFSALDEAGFIAFAMQPRTESAAAALQAAIASLDRMSKESVSARELADAKTAAESAFLMRIETQAGLADELVSEKMLGLAPGYRESYCARLDAVDADSVREASRKYLAPEDDAIVISGDASKIGPQLSAIGPFEVVKSK